MKKSVCFALGFLFFIILINSAFAISTTIKESYLQGETVVSEIAGNILEPIIIDNVKFLKKWHIEAPFESDVKQIGEKYYIWFITPKNETNYTLLIKNIATTISGVNKKIDYEKNFSVLNTISDYSISPGFISTDKNFSIKAILNEDYEKPININLIEKSNFTLKPGENTIKFLVSEINESKSLDLIIGKYTLPAYLKANVKNIAINLTINNKTILNLSGLLNFNMTNLSEEDREAWKKQVGKYQCDDYLGKICVADEKCSGTIVPALDGSCCVDGTCKKINKEKPRTSWIGYIIGAIVFAGGIFLWIKYKKVKKEENPIASKIKSFEKPHP